MAYTTNLTIPGMAAGRFIPKHIVPTLPATEIKRLYSPELSYRLQAVSNMSRVLKDAAVRSEGNRPMGNHFHSWESWGPGSASALAVFSAANNLQVTGIVDHYSVRGFEEFRAACDTLGVLSTCGYEMRALVRDKMMCGDVDLSKTVINSPGNPGEAYIVFHGVVPGQNQFLALARADKTERYRQVVEKLNQLLEGKTAERLNFEDILATRTQGDNVLDRHITDALFDLLHTDAKGDFAGIFDRIGSWWGTITTKEEQALLSAETAYSRYIAATGMLRSRLLQRDKPAYVMPSEIECPPLEYLIAIAREEGSLLVYPYLGTEDAYLDEHVELMQRLGFDAISGMPNRNTEDQTARIRSLSQQAGLPYISGMDVNNLTQDWIDVSWSFDPELINTALMLVGHEFAVKNGMGGFNSPSISRAFPRLSDRIAHFVNVARTSQILD